MNVRKLITKCLAVLMLLGLISVAEANEGGGGGGGGSPDIIAMEPLVVNLKEGHYIQFKPLVKLASLTNAEYVRASTPLIRFELIKFMIGRDNAEVGDAKFMRDFSESAAEVLNKALHGELIKEVLFDSWLIQ